MRTSIKIPLESLPNTRDLGGMETTDGRHIKSGVLLRSGTLCNASEKDLHILCEDYHLHQIIDFRTLHEQNGKPDPQLPGVSHIGNPILEEKALGITREGKADSLSLILQIFRTNPITPEQYMTKMYDDLSTSAYGCQQYSRFLQHLLTNPSGASLWHCSLGKDRVGVGTALLQYLLGVSMEDIIADYMLTGEYLAAHTEMEVEQARPLARSEKELDCVRAVASVKEEYITSIFTSIEEKFGSMEHYYTDVMHLSKEDQNTLKDLYLI